MLDQVQITDKDISGALAATAMLVSFESRTWTGEASDRTATQDVREARKAQGDVGRFHKNLLANNDGPLKAVVRAISAAYRDHIDMTGPWNGGYRLLPNAGFEKYLQTMAKHQATIGAAVEALRAAYPDLVEASIVSLGGLADRSQYPGADEIAGRFGIRFDFEPVPGGQGFPGLPPQYAQALQAQLGRQIAERMEAATKDLWRQIRETLERYHRQTRPDGKIYDANVEDTLGLPARIRAFNVLQDAQLDGIANMIERELGAYNRKALDDEPCRNWCHAKSGTIVGLLPS